MNVHSERKYLVPNDEQANLRRRLMPFVRPDPFAERHDQISEYTVRSIYFDTPTLSALTEKVEGFQLKRKLRVRGYNEHRRGDDVFLEIKERNGDKVWKHRARTRYDRLSDALETGELQPAAGPVPVSMLTAGRRFFYLFKRHAHRPVNVVVYEREPFIGKFDPGVRITIDKSIRAALFPDLTDLYNDARLSPVWRNAFVLEVKHYSPAMPSWMRSVIREFQLQRVSVSKYRAAFRDRDISLYNIRI